MPTSLGIMQIFFGPPPPPPPCDGCWPTPQDATTRANTISRATRTTLNLHAGLATFSPPFRYAFALLHLQLPSLSAGHSSLLRKNSFRNTATRSRTPSTKTIQVLGTPASVRPLRNVAMMRTPSTVPPMVPDPP